MIADVVMATSTTPALLENVSVVASIAVAMLTISSAIFGLVLFVYKVHVNGINNAKDIASLNLKLREIETEAKIKLEALAIEHQRIELALVAYGVPLHPASAPKQGGTP